MEKKLQKLATADREQYSKLIAEERLSPIVAELRRTTNSREAYILYLMREDIVDIPELNDHKQQMRHFQVSDQELFLCAQQIFTEHLFLNGEIASSIAFLCSQAEERRLCIEEVFRHIEDEVCLRRSYSPLQKMCTFRCVINFRKAVSLTSIRLMII
jgi:septum formation topological specificity factor MinE